MRLIFPFLFTLLSFEASAIDIFMVRISNDFEPEKTYDLILDVETNGKIKGIKTRNNKKKKVKYYPPKVLDQSMTLLKAAGAKLITLECKKFRPDKGCDIIIRYPSNLILFKFKEFHAKIKMNKGQWGMYSQQDQKFRRMHLVSKKTLGLITGIKRNLNKAFGNCSVPHISL